MPDVLIDPFLFACPDNTADLQEFEQYIYNLTEWKNIREAFWLSPFLLRDTYEILFINNKYPIFPDIQYLIEKYSIDYIQAKDIVVLVNSYLQRLPNIETAINIADILSEDSELNPVFTDRSVHFLENLHRIFDLAQIKEILEGEAKTDKFFFIVNYTNPSIEYSSNIAIVQFTNDNNLDCPIKFSKEFKTIHRLANASEDISVEDIWSIAGNATQYLRCIKFSTKRVSLAHDIAFDDEHFEQNVRFGRDFLTNLIDLHFMNNPERMSMIISTLSEVILSLGLGSTHALRTGRGANDPQITSGGFRAWRKDIDYEYHLHYWKEEQTFIFANVGPHNNFRISPL